MQKFEYKGMQTFKVTDYRKQVSVKHPLKMRIYCSSVHKIKGAHLHCMNNYYTKFENKGIKIVGVTDYTNQSPSKHFEQKKMSKFNTPKNEIIFMKFDKREGAHP